MSGGTYLLTGQNTYSVALALEGFKAGLGAGDLLEANYTRIDAEKITPEDLGLFVSAAPFLAPKRLVVVFGLMERFEKQPRQPKKHARNKSGDDEDITALFAGVITNKPDSTELVIVAGNITGKNPLLETLGNNIEKKDYPLLSGEKLLEWITDHVRSDGGEITPDAARLLLRQVGPDLWTMKNEIEKLVLFSGGEKIDAGTVAMMVSITPEANIFRMIDAVVAGRSTAAELELEKLLSNGVPPSQVISMLARQVRMIAVAQDMLKRGFRSADIRKKLGIKHDFIMQKLDQSAKSFKISAIYKYYLQLAGAEMDIKTGRLEPELALSVLVENLTRTR
ncbi:MAG: DNA polymerase III subunit delta [Dehalococcoidales bacterium]